MFNQKHNFSSLQDLFQKTSGKTTTLLEKRPHQVIEQPPQQSRLPQK